MLYAQVKELKLLCKANDLTQVGTKITLQMKLAVNGIGPQTLPVASKPLAAALEDDPVAHMTRLVTVCGRWSDTVALAEAPSGGSPSALHLRWLYVFRLARTG